MLARDHTPLRSTGRMASSSASVQTGQRGKGFVRTGVPPRRAGVAAFVVRMSGAALAGGNIASVVAAVDVARNRRRESFFLSIVFLLRLVQLELVDSTSPRPASASARIGGASLTRRHEMLAMCIASVPHTAQPFAAHGLFGAQALACPGQCSLKAELQTCARDDARFDHFVNFVRANSL